MKAFEFRDNFNVSRFPRCLKKVYNYLKDVGIINVNLKELDDLWIKFSEECYAAGYLDPHNDNLEHFAEWLSEQDM